MGFSLKERREREMLRKEQKRAERMAIKTEMTGEELVKALGRGRQISANDLERMQQSVAVFRNGGEELERVLAELKLKHMVLYKAVEEHLKGDWMGNFEKLIASIPDVKKFRPFAITWPEWRQFGMAAGMNEEDVVGALKVMLVFRDR